MPTGSASAQDSEDEAPAEEEPASGTLPPTVVIFVIDLSGSMNELFDGDRTKLDVAKQAFSEAFANVSPTAFVGLRVYGDQLPATAPAGRSRNCTEDTRLVVPITKIDRDALIDEVQSFDARGDTAIGLALRAANNDIPEGTLGTVVLFSDGRDECFDADLDGDPAVGPSFGEDPCEVAKDIAGEGVDLRIDRVETVGFGADEAAELELRCIADSTGGSYTPIETPEDARDLLPELLADISSPREAERLGGTPIVGTPTDAGAPALSRQDGAGGGDGRYTDSIEMNGEKWYRISEYGPGGGTITATAFGLPAQDGIEFGLRLYLPETDQTFFESRLDANAGIPRRPTASVRCPGCSVSGGPNDAFWVVILTTDNPELGGTYDLELLTEGPAFGGLSTSCVEPQECWFEQEVAARAAEVAEVEAEYELLLGENVPRDLIDRRQDVVDKLDGLEAELASAKASAGDAESSASDVQVRVDDLEAQAEELGGDKTSLGLPLLLILVGLIAGGLPTLLNRRTAADTSDADESKTEQHSVVIGTVEQPGPMTESVGAQEVVGPQEAVVTPREGEVPRPPLTGGASTPSDIGEGSTSNSVEEVDEEPTGAGDGSTLEVSEDPTALESSTDLSETAVEEEPVTVTEAAPDAQGLESPEPGWYEDPGGGAKLRWWDGSEWTDHLADNDRSDDS